jgi:4-amino-4-deoxy-L-arabinose transferase-like glycosyltransferase
MLSDQIVWFIPLALFGILAAFLKEKLTFKLDNDRKQQIMLWTMWFVPVFIYFSFNTGTFHPYYLTMLAPPIAALAGIGLTEMWNLYKEGGLKSWLLPIALLANGVVQLLMLSYFISSSLIIIILIALLMIFTFVSSIILIFLNLIKRNKEGVNNLELLKIKKIFIITAFIGLLFTPMVGSGAVLFNELNGTIPVAGLELLSESSKGFGMAGNNVSTNSKLVQYLKANKTSSEKYLLVVANSNSASDIIINSGESVMSLGGFLGSDNIISLDEFKQLAKNGEVRFVMVSENGVQGGNSSSSISAIMNWVKANGKKVASSEYSNASSSGNNMHGDNGSNGQLYDLKAYTDSNKGK